MDERKAEHTGNNKDNESPDQPVNAENETLQGLSETAVMDVMSSSLQQQRIIVEQLRREAAVERQSVSESCAAMMRYISQHEQEDYLLTGFTSQKVNPFREKSSCSVL